MLASADTSQVRRTGSVLDDAQLEEFEEEHSREMEGSVAGAALEHLENLSVAAVRNFLEASDIPGNCLAPIIGFTVQDFEGIEDFEIISNKKGEDDESIVLLCAFDLLSVIWTVEIPTAAYNSNIAEFQQHFLNIDANPDVTTMQLVQRCYFESALVFNQQQKEFTGASIKLTAVHHR